MPVTFTSNTTTFLGGFWAAMEATQGSFGGDTSTETGSLDFSNTFSWAGPGLLVLGGTTYGSSQFTVTATSGANYESAFAPEPATIWGIGMGLCAVALALKRRR